MKTATVYEEFSGVVKYTPNISVINKSKFIDAWLLLLQVYRSLKSAVH
jgi:hypothetical protein